MNVLIYTSNSHYSNHFVGGAETSLELIAMKLAQRGERVCLVTLLQSGKEVVEKRQVGPLTIYRVNFISHKTIPSKVYASIARIIRSEKIQIVHSYEITDTSVILKIRDNYKLNYKVVYRVAGLYWSFKLSQQRFTKKEVEYVFNSSDAINYLSAPSKRLFYRRIAHHHINFKPKREFILDIGIDLDLFQYSWQKPASDQKFRIVCIAKFTKNQKRQDILIEAMRSLDERFVVHFFGEGPTLEHFKKIVKEYRLTKQIKFHGYLSQKRIVQVLTKVDLFALATDYEGMPKSLLEAMAVGTPCLASRVLPMNKYLKNDVTGFLAANKPSVWVTMLKELSKKKQKALLNISAKARGWVERKYDARKNILQYQKVFHELISQK